MSSSPGNSDQYALVPWRAALVRGALLLALWVVLIGAAPLDLAVGAATVAAATWISLRLLSPMRSRLRIAVLPGLALRFLYQSVMAGIDVARRAFDPRVPLRLGFTRYAVGFRRGPARNTFAALTSLLPGTVPAGEDDSSLLYHCLDVDQPVAEQLAAEEEALRGARRETSA